MRIVRRGAPGTAVAHNPGGSCSTKKTVTRLLVRQVPKIVSRRSGITSTRSFTQDRARLDSAILALTSRFTRAAGGGSVSGKRIVPFDIS